MNKNNIRVLVVDDSLFMREFISSQLSGDTGIEVVGKAGSAYEARDKIIELMPDVMTLDIQMPGMDGIEFLRQLMPQFPLPVVVVSAVSGRVFDAMNAGAVDFINKSDIKGEQGRRQFIHEMIIKLKIASVARVGQHKHSVSHALIKSKLKGHASGNELIAIGASTGGTEATFTILKELGNDLPGIVIVQHMPPVFTRLYAERLNENCAMEVKEAQDGDAVKPGSVLIAPGALHMTVARRGSGLYVECREGAKVNGHCPSVDQIFYSISQLKGITSLGILLTGMGGDGAEGLLAMKKADASTIGQDQQTSVVYGMPAVAAKIGAVDVQLPLQDIARSIYEWYGKVSSGKE
jgi:two-component system, chemotaxis family, protein-glutamate methylesterase/glutaminase